jgi:hypothetical protein
VHATVVGNLPGVVKNPPPRTLVLDRIHNFRGFGGFLSSCRVRVFSNQEFWVVVLSEEPGNPGSSVTCAAELIASELLPQLSCRPGFEHRIIWIEHWPYSSITLPVAEALKGNSIPPLGDAFDRIHFDVFLEPDSPHRKALWWAKKCKFGAYLQPKWVRITKQEVERLIGSEWQ